MSNLSQTKKCPDCGGQLEEGYSFAQYLVTYAKHNHADIKNKKFIWKPLKLENMRRVLQYRCEKCNRIFSYADDFIIYKNNKNQYLIVFSVFIIIFIIAFLVTFFLG